MVDVEGGFGAIFPLRSLWAFFFEEREGERRLLADEAEKGSLLSLSAPLQGPRALNRRGLRVSKIKHSFPT